MDALWLHIVQWLHTVGLHVDAGTAREVAGGMAQVTQKLDMPSLLALAAALGWASGFRLYAVVFIVGLMGATGALALPAGLHILENPLVLAVAGTLMLVEFFADKVPWIDSAWDAVHTVIRVPGGALLAAGVFGADSATMGVIAGLLGGTLAAGSASTDDVDRLIGRDVPQPVGQLHQRNQHGARHVGLGVLVRLTYVDQRHPLLQVGTEVVERYLGDVGHREVAS